MDHNNRFGAFYGDKSREDLLRGSREDLLRMYREQGMYGQEQAYAAAWEQRKMEWERLQRGAGPPPQEETVRKESTFAWPGAGGGEWRQDTTNNMGHDRRHDVVQEKRQDVTQERRQDLVQERRHTGQKEEKEERQGQTVIEALLRSENTRLVEDQNSLHSTMGSNVAKCIENNVNENVNPKEETAIEENDQDIDEDETKWLNSSNDVDPDLEDYDQMEFKTVAGWVYLNTWQLQKDLSIQYAIRFDSAKPATGHTVQVADVFVNLDEAIKLLTCVSGQVKVKPPNIKTIWTITVAQEDLDFCPLTEFVYHAALKASGKKFKKVYEGILNEIIRNLFTSNDVNQSDSIKEYAEKNYSVNDYFDGTGGKQRLQNSQQLERKSKRKTEDFQGWSTMEEMLDEELSTHDSRGVKVEVKLEPGGSDRDWEPASKHRKSKKLSERIYDCNLCDKSYSKNVRLYRHQLQAHPHQSELHIEKPLSMVRQEERVKMEKDQGGGNEAACNDDADHDDEVGRYERVGSFRCKECHKPFIRLMILINHCRREHPDKPEICPEEPLKLGLLDTLHERTPVKTAEGEIFTCGLSLCNLKFDRYLSLVDHERTHSEAFICILCGLCCYSAENLIGHSDQQHPRKSEFICRVCGFFNRKADTLKTHVQQEHMQGAVLFQCEECPYNTEKKQSLHNHKRTAHREQEFYCDICGKNYASGASLYVHKKSHDPDFKKFQCKLCPAKFAYSSGLSYHMAVHTGEKPFQCNQCGSNFGSHTALSRHVKVLHAEEKDMVFQCEHCGKKFPKRMGREYRDHVKVHTGERDHICSICGSGYFSRKMLRKHELKKHAHILPKKAQPIRINPDTVPQLTVSHNAASAALQGAV